MHQTSFQSHAPHGATKRFAIAANLLAKMDAVGVVGIVVRVSLVALLIGFASSAQARTETLRWSHSTTDVAGFRVYQSSTPGTLGNNPDVDLLLAETFQDPTDGTFSADIVVPDSATAYVTLTAYSDLNVESFRSNEKELAPPPPPPPSDRDGDGVPDSQDAFPDDASEWQDSDGDGHGDVEDVFDNDPTEWADADGDGYGDNNDDRFPNDATEWADSDNDGYGDVEDVFDNDPTEWADADGDGFGDNIADRFPGDATEWADSDDDGHGDNSDAFPLDPTQWAFTNVLSPYRVSAGESQDYPEQDGRTWTRDMGFFNTGISNAISANTPIAGTSSDEVYQSSRTDQATGDEMMFSFPLTNGSYTVRLHFAEHNFTQVGQRFFNVEVEGASMLQDFDILDAAGGEQYKAVVRSDTFEVTDGVLEIEFLHRAGGSDPTVMGIEVVSNEALEGEVLTTPGKPSVQ